MNYLLILIFMFFLGNVDNINIDDIQKENSVTNHIPFEPPPVKNDEVYLIVEKQPEFPGGTVKMLEFIIDNLLYPKQAYENEIQGRVICTFTVKKNGEIDNVEVARSIDPLLDKEAVRLIESMPNWIPGRNNDEAVNSKFTLPVIFKLPPDSQLKEGVVRFTDGTRYEVTPPEYPGGEKAFKEYVASRVGFPKSAIEEGFQGVVEMILTINNQGVIDNIRYIGGTPVIQKKIEKVLKKSRKWKPGEIEGKPTTTTYSLPLVFLIQGEDHEPFEDEISEDSIIIMGYKTMRLW